MRTAVFTIGLAFVIGSFLSDIRGSEEKESSETDRNLEQLKFQFEVLMEEKKKPLRELAGSYRKRLETIANAMQKQGDLPGLLEVRKELERLSQGTSLEHTFGANESIPEALRSSREIYGREQARLSEQARLEINGLIVPYRKGLESMISSLTREGNLEAAVAARKQLEQAPDVFPDSGGVAKMLSLSEKSGATNLKLKVQVDGVSYLKMQGNKIWFDHTQGRNAPPGRHQGEFPTYINEKKEWMPVWNGRITEPFEVDAKLPVKVEDIQVHVRTLEGRGHVEIAEQPSKENGFTLTVKLIDANESGKGFFGSEWIEFRLSW